KDNASLFIEAHPAPVVRCSNSLPGVLGPGIVAELSRMRNGMKNPAKFAAPYIISPDMSRCRSSPLRHARTHDQQIFEDHARTAGRNVQVRSISIQVFSQIDHTAPAELTDDGSRICV